MASNNDTFSSDRGDKPRRVGILTGGGDCAGLNAVIRAVVMHAASLGWEVMAIEYGGKGLAERPPHGRILTIADVDSGGMGCDWLRRGGTLIGATNRDSPFVSRRSEINPTDKTNAYIEGLRLLGCEALIGIGGDGTLDIFSRLAVMGNIDLVAVPKTVDNDVGLTEAAVGFDTAVAVATEALDRLQPTAVSHERIMVLEVMGHGVGHIALAAGIAGGADVILIPEIACNLACVVEHIAALRRRGRNSALVVVAEAVRFIDGEHVLQSRPNEKARLGGIGYRISEYLSDHCGMESRATILGHVQRGAAPNARDRIVASVFGVRAMDLVAAGKYGRMVAWQDGGVRDVPITDAISREQRVNVMGDLVATARGLGICLGDNNA